MAISNSYVTIYQRVSGMGDKDVEKPMAKHMFNFLVELEELFFTRVQLKCTNWVANPKDPWLLKPCGLPNNIDVYWPIPLRKQGGKGKRCWEARLSFVSFRMLNWIFLGSDAEQWRNFFVVVCGWVMVATRWSRIICYEYNVSEVG